MFTDTYFKDTWILAVKVWVHFKVCERKHEWYDAAHGSGDSSYTSTPGSSSNVTLASSASSCKANTSSYNREISTSNNTMPDLCGGRNKYGAVLTHFMSVTENTLPVMNMRRGMVRMRTKGSAREKELIFTNHRTARHTSWIRVNKCIRIVVTCTKYNRGER